MRRVFVSALLGLLLGFVSTSTSAVAHGGGGGGDGGGGGGWWCRLMCYLAHGSCTIPSGDPDIPPLKDPFCEQRRNDCLAGCGGDSGGGGLVIGWNSPEAGGPLRMSPQATLACGT